MVPVEEDNRIQKQYTDDTVSLQNSNFAASSIDNRINTHDSDRDDDGLKCAQRVIDVNGNPSQEDSHDRFKFERKEQQRQQASSDRLSEKGKNKWKKRTYSVTMAYAFYLARRCVLDKQFIKTRIYSTNMVK